MIRRYLIANWKMQLGVAESEALARDELAACGKMNEGIIVVICPSFPAIERVGKICKDSYCFLGAQDLFWEERGQYTGEVSSRMLKELGVRYVIVGHSERRQHLGETDEMVNRKVRRALSAELIPILCVGETRAEREAGQRDAVVERQVRAALADVRIKEKDKLVIAYEPVWVIGSGQAVAPEDAVRSHAVIRRVAAKLFPPAFKGGRIATIYGGSVNSTNIAGFMKRPEIEGALVGGASLNAKEFALVVSKVRQTVLRKKTP